MGQFDARKLWGAEIQEMQLVRDADGAYLAAAVRITLAAQISEAMMGPSASIALSIPIDENSSLFDAEKALVQACQSLLARILQVNEEESAFGDPLPSVTFIGHLT